MSFLSGFSPITTADTLCSGYTPNLWFSPKAADKELAIQICGHCPAQDECFTAAMENKEEYGIWGGTTPQERKKLWTEMSEDLSTQ